MRTYWSVFTSLLLLTLVGCGAEQFGTSPTSHKPQTNGLRSFEQLSCSTYTLIKPKVDILYVVDNSTSTYYIENDIKTAIKATVDSVSKQFDYRVIGTPLLQTPAGNEDYQVITNSQDPLSSAASSKRIISSSEFNFFSNKVDGGKEPGLARVTSFINAHLSDGLFRQNAYLLIVLISNGRDTDIETAAGYGNEETNQNLTVYNARRNSLLNIKNALNSQQFRLFSVTAPSSCTKSGWLSSEQSYIQMSKEIYESTAFQNAPYPADQGSKSKPDHYNLCDGGLPAVFAGVNNSIQQVRIDHVYRYWPITFAENNETVSLNDIQVFKVSGNSAPVILPQSSWSYHQNAGGGPLNTRELPTPGEPVSGTHFVRFNDGSLITYPDCVMVRSISRTEYFGYIVLPKEPIPGSIVVRINGQTIPQNSSNGWTYVGSRSNQNIKIPFPSAGDELPAVIKSGFMIQLNGSASYYKSGDNVEAHYIPAGI